MQFRLDYSPLPTSGGSGTTSPTFTPAADAAPLFNSIAYFAGMSLNVVQLARRKAEREKAIQRVKDAMDEIDAIGVQVKDLDIGLLDFPCEVDGQVVLLCWKLGEPEVLHWHELDAGFRGRQSLTADSVADGG